MVYLIEKYKLTPATPHQLDAFIAFAQSHLLPFYSENRADLKIAWNDHANHLFQVGQLIEFPDSASCVTFLMTIRKNETIQTQLNLFAPQREYQAFQSASPVFIDVLDQAISDSRDSPLNTLTVATLKMAPGQMESLIPKQEGAARIGMPLIAFLNALTGNPNLVIDIWKGDLQEAGYQDKTFYDAVGMPEDYWKWIRQIAPEEKMSRVHLLPHSPLK